VDAQQLVGEPPCCRAGLARRGQDQVDVPFQADEFPADGPRPAVYGVEMKGNGIFLHTDTHDRPADVFAGTTTLVSGPGQACYLLLPFIPRGSKR
jgi:hypothetical protein